MIVELFLDKYGFHIYGIADVFDDIFYGKNSIYSMMNKNSEYNRIDLRLD
jgi:hypothetical protein